MRGTMGTQGNRERKKETHTHTPMRVLQDPEIGTYIFSTRWLKEQSDWIKNKMLLHLSLLGYLLMVENKFCKQYQKCYENTL